MNKLSTTPTVIHFEGRLVLRLSRACGQLLAGKYAIAEALVLRRERHSWRTSYNLIDF